MVTSLAVTASGQQCAVGLSNGEIAFLSTSTAREGGRFYGHTAAVTCLAATEGGAPRSAAFLSGAADGLAMLWDPRSAKVTSPTLPMPTASCNSVGIEGLGDTVILSSCSAACSLLRLFCRMQSGEASFKPVRNGQPTAHSILESLASFRSCALRLVWLGQILTLLQRA